MSQQRYFISNFNFVLIYHLHRLCYMHCPSSHPWFHHTNNKWTWARIMKFLIVHFYLSSCYLFLKIIYSSQAANIYTHTVMDLQFHESLFKFMFKNCRGLFQKQIWTPILSWIWVTWSCTLTIDIISNIRPLLQKICVLGIQHR